MILFLDFAPIEFMGGAERWMLDTSNRIGKGEKVEILSAPAFIANIYSLIVLKRKFSKRKGVSLRNCSSLTLSSFIPFTESWKAAKKKFNDARLIYIKYDLNEVLLLLYFGGFSAIKKTIAGVHSPFLYVDPITPFDYLHNLLYGSSINKFFLKHVHKVHVLNNRDRTYLEKNFELKNIIQVPNGVESPKVQAQHKKGSDKLNILFIGDLSIRKGIDILLEVIIDSPDTFNYTIAGDGFLRKEVETLQDFLPRCNYIGYLSHEKLQKLYLENDVLIIPSRAESMSLVLLEALSHGLTVVDSKNIAFGLGEGMEYACDNKDISTYVRALKKIYSLKQGKDLKRKEIVKYFKENYSIQKVEPRLRRDVFGLVS